MIPSLCVPPANSTPDGKLYIHFTAFWSLVLYFMLEDDMVKITYYFIFIFF
jgi:hypothetical protein